MGMRTAYICYRCGEGDGVPVRKFLTEGEPIPRCSTHGLMTLQPNMPYFGELPKGSTAKEVEAARKRVAAILRSA